MVVVDLGLMKIILEIDAAEGSLIRDLIRGALEKADIWSQPRYVESLRFIEAKLIAAAAHSPVPKLETSEPGDFDVFLP